MNKKAIASDAIAIIIVLFFTIIITTGTLFWLNVSDTKQHLIELESETINQGIILRNYLRTQFNNETNMAELIVQLITQEGAKQLLEQHTEYIKPFFSELQILNGNTEIITIKGNQEKPSKKAKITLEQTIPNYFDTQPLTYTIRLIIQK